MQLDFTLQFTDNAWYPTLDMNGFKSTTGASIDIQEKMTLSFTAPGKITEGDITIATNPWCALKTSIESSEVASGIFDIKLAISAADGSALGNAIENIHMGVNVSSDSAPKWETFRDTFSVAADDGGLSGKKSVTTGVCDECWPDPASGTAPGKRSIRR